MNPPLRTALARVDRAEPLHLSVGTTELRVASLGATHVERKVALPDRWVRGLAEVPAATRGMTAAGALDGPAIARFVGGLPRVAPPGPTLHVLTSAGGWRVSGRPVPGAVPLAGASRLRGSDRVLRHATRLRVFASPGGSTAWVFDVPGGRLTLVLSPDPFRGFSGEGSLLDLLSSADAEAHGRRLLAELGWAPYVEPAELGRRTGLDDAAVAAGLAWLSASGRLGFDLVDRTYFQRELPVDTEKVLRHNPRLVAARRLVESGAVRRTTDAWAVRGDEGTTYALSPDLRCSCAWELEHGGARGPCKHRLAVEITRHSDVAASSAGHGAPTGTRGTP